MWLFEQIFFTLFSSGYVRLYSFEDLAKPAVVLYYNPLWWVMLQDIPRNPENSGTVVLFIVLAFINLMLLFRWKRLRLHSTLYLLIILWGPWLVEMLVRNDTSALKSL